MEKDKCCCGCECDCGCDCGCDCDCGFSQTNIDKEIAFELCRTVIDGRTFTADAVADAYVKIFNAVKSCKSSD